MVSKPLPKPSRAPVVIRLKPLVAAIRLLILGGLAVGAGPARAALPTPADVLPVPTPGGFVTSGNVDAPVVNGHAMTIRQHSSKAVLDWQSFNIGKANSVEFKQPDATSIALNNIHQADPSRIEGKLTANGQIYLINQNGFLFGKDARINTNTLVASTLNISQSNFDTGLSKVINLKGNPAALEKDPSLTGKAAYYQTQNGPDGKPLKDAQGNPVLRLDEKGQPVPRGITVEAGAQIKSQDGGRVMLFAPHIENQGRIDTPDGQAILAAAEDKVYLQEASPDPAVDEKTGKAADKSLAKNYVRGLLVEVGAGGDVKNVGEMAARRGNITLAGFAVNQEGIVSATTSVRLNGSIRLIAREKGNQPVRVDPGSQLPVLLPDSTERGQDNGDGLGKSARVVLGQGSLTQVTPDNSGETALDDQAQERSKIEIMGKQVEIQEAATASAPSGDMSIHATVQPAEPDQAKDSNGGATLAVKLGAKLDVAGLKNVAVPMSRNLVEVEPRSYELRDARLQIDGPLYGQKIYVDLRNGTPKIVDISGGTARTERTVAERSVAGGTLTLSSAGDIAVQPEATLDVSGGSVRYQGGYVKTTWLSSQGKFYEISKADPNRQYDGILGQFSQTDSRWGVTQTWNTPGPVNNGRYEPGYVEGKAGGELDIRANHLDLEGQVLGQTIDGLHQRESAQRAAGSSLNIDLAFSDKSTQDAAIISAVADLEEQIKQLSPTADTTQNTPLVITDRFLNRSGLRDTTIITNRTAGIAKQADVRLSGEAGLTLMAGAIEVQGKVSAPAGRITLDTRLRKEPLVGPDPLSSGAIHLAKGARLDVSGQWINDTTAGGAALIQGGSVKASAAGSLNVDAGAEIAADGGAWLKSTGALADGEGGSISLAALRSLSGAPGSNLALDGSVHAYGLLKGGSLGLETNEILVGSAFGEDYQPAANPALQPLVLPADFFNAGGFRNYALTADLRNLRLGSDAELTLQAMNWTLDQNFRQQPTGTNLARFTTPQILDDSLRQPVNLSLKSESPVDLFSLDSGVILEPGSKLLADPGAKIDLRSDHRIVLGGTVNAPAGTLQATVAASQDIPYQRTQGIYIDDTARLLAAGTVQPVAGGVPGLRDDKVLGGGSISLNANRGYIVLAEGAVADVSGASAVIDETRPKANGPGTDSVATVHAARAGSLSFTAAEGVALAGELRGRSQRSQGAAGGGLSLTLDKTLRNAGEKLATYPAGPEVIQVSQDIQAGLLDGWRFGTAVPKTLDGLGLVSANQIEQGGFDAVTLKTREDNGAIYTNQPEVRFLGDVSLTTGDRIILDTPTIGLAPTSTQAAPTVQLDTNYLALGSSTVREQIPAASGGPGQFNGLANNIELIGGLRVIGANATTLASAGDLRLRGVAGDRNKIPVPRDLTGSFSAFGDLTLSAAQIYPATLSQYAITLAGTGGTLAVQGAGRAGPVLSAGGQLSLTAPNIDASGVLKAPFGQIKLTAANNLTLEDGAVVSVSGAGLTIPFGKTQGGLDWLYPLDGGLNLVYGLSANQVAPPSGAIRLSGATVDLQEGSSINLSGGGDLYAYELVPGRGGSADQLDPRDPKYLDADSGFTYQEKYAVLPWLKAGFAPYDPYTTPKSGLRVGDAVYLADPAAGLPAGTYTLLPANYALLPGGYVVTPTPAANPQPGSIGYAVDGTPIVAGQKAVAGTGFRDYQWRGYAVESGVSFRRRTEYDEFTATEFFANQAKRLGTDLPALPRDAANLAVEAASRLNLGGAVLGQAAPGGHGGQLDIAGNSLRVVQQAGTESAQTNEVQLLSQQLSDLQVESLLLGGLRQDEGKSRRIAIKSDRVVIDSGVALQGPEIVLAAKTGIEVKDGAKLQGTGPLNSKVTEFHIQNADGASDGALLRVSSGEQASVIRDQAVQNGKGSISVGAGTMLSADGSALLDATADAAFSGGFDMPTGSLSIGAGRINLGAAPAGTPGLALTAERLAGFQGDELILRSAETLGMYGDFSFQASKNLDIRAPGLAGFGVTGTSRLAAGQITLSNPGASSTSNVATGTGNLVLQADQVFQFGKGDFAIGGFAATQIQAKDRITAAGQGGLRVAGDASLDAPLFTAASGATVSLAADGHALNIGSTQPTAATPANAGLGAKLTLSADSIGLDTRLGLPSGSLNATAAQGVTLGANARLDVSGVAQTYLDKTVYTPGGQVALTSKQGDVTLAQGGEINVAGQTQAGSVSLAAPEGTLALQGKLSGAALASNGTGASLSFDAGRLGEADLSALFGYAQGMGSAESIELRLRQGDLTVTADAVLQAHELSLAADSGSVAVAGTLDATGDKAGVITLAAGDQVRLQSSAKLLAGTDTLNGKGGRIEIESLNRDEDDTAGVQVDAGATLNVRGGKLDNPSLAADADGMRYVADGPTVSDNGQDYLAGDIHVRVLRENLNGLSDQFGAATLSGAQAITVEAVKVYDQIDTIDAGQIAVWQADTQAYMAGLKASAPPGLKVVPGIEIRNSGDISFADAWDFSGAAWRYGADGATPGVLSILAQGNLKLNRSLSDGVASGSIGDGSGTAAEFSALIQPGESWSYRLVAGADAGSAATGRTLAGVGDITVASGAAVRTGTGAIELHAGRDVVLQDQSAAVYTVGTVSALDDPTRYGTLGNSTAVNLFYAEYTVRGGDIAISAGGDIKGAKTSQFVPDWLVRTGNWNPASTNISDHNPVAWGVALSQSGLLQEGNTAFYIPAEFRGFQQNVGALGGGNVAVSAGGAIQDLSVVIPTVAKQVGQRVSQDAENIAVIHNQLEVHGGGDLSVQAGSDINGGLFYVEKGVGDIQAGDAIQGGTQYTTGPLFSLGDATLNLAARTDLAVGTVFNPSLLRERSITGDSNNFVTYTARSGINLAAMAGNIDLENDVSAIEANYPKTLIGNATKTEGDYAGLYYYPGNLAVHAYSGSVDIKRSITLAPAATGNLEIFADNAILGGRGNTNPVWVNLSDADPSELPSPLRPAPNLIDFSAKSTNPQTGSAALFHALTPIHIEDDQPVRVATQRGDIANATGSANADFSWYLPKPLQLAAGNDLRNVNLDIQNLKDSDVSTVSAQRNLSYVTNRNANGDLVVGAFTRFFINGPGKLEVLAGGNIDLGSSSGIVSIGNQQNPALSGTGASMAVIAGLNPAAQTAQAEADGATAKEGWNGFLFTYLNKLTAQDLTAHPDLAARLEGYGWAKKDEQGGLQIQSVTQDAIAALPQSEQIALALPVFFDQIRAAGVDAAKHGNQKKYYEPGFQAIASLFPGDAYQGDISLFFSGIKSTSGGGIDLLVPGGTINAGLTNAALGAAKKSSDLGVVVQGEGAINGFAKNDFTVNESRVVTLGGGDITLWSSDGNIDAGKGAKSAISAPPPITTFDDKGNIKVVYPPVLEGSGIRTASSAGPDAAGSVYLFAPRGIVDAGEAGIGGNNVVIAATAVIGATNIQVSGASIGVPAAPPPIVVPGAASNAASAAAQSGSQQVTENASDKEAKAKAAKDAQMGLGLLQVDLLGFGECSVSDVKGGNPGCGG